MPNLNKLLETKIKLEKQIAKLLDPKVLERQNKAFHNLSNKKKRVAIAKDVLAQLKLEKYVATPLVYVESSALSELENSDSFVGKAFDLQKALLGNAPQCDVCGLGAAVCSMARLGDKLTLYQCNHHPHEALKPIFGAQQVALIEYAFEGEDAGGTMDDLSAKEIDACEEFFERYPDDTKRLAAIFRNVIANDGTFKP